MAEKGPLIRPGENFKNWELFQSRGKKEKKKHDEETHFSFELTRKKIQKLYRMFSKMTS
jgi:hypothetical protein